MAAMRFGPALEALAIPVGALVAAMLLFGVFVLMLGQNPIEVYGLIYEGGFSSAFSWQNSLSRAAPLILTALAVAIPARIGLVMIGGAGARVVGGFASAAIAIHCGGVGVPSPRTREKPRNLNDFGALHWRYRWDLNPRWG